MAKAVKRGKVQQVGVGSIGDVTMVLLDTGTGGFAICHYSEHDDKRRALVESTLRIPIEHPAEIEHLRDFFVAMAEKYPWTEEDDEESS